jgi:hypothetical protein
MAPSVAMELKIDRKEIAIGTAVLSVACLGILLAAIFGGDSFSRRLLAELEGNVVGLSAPAYAVAWAIALCTPLPFWFWHLLVVQHYAKDRARKRRSMGTSPIGAAAAVVDYLHFLVTSKESSRLLRRAKLVSAAGIVYLLSVFGWWLYWTDSRGL